MRFTRIQGVNGKTEDKEMADNITIRQFNDFVRRNEALGIQHDQVQCGGGVLVSVENSTGSKIKRFFSFLSSVGSEQVAKNREIRTKLLAAIRNENNGRIPSGLKDILKECGFDLSRKNDQSYKSLSTRAIRSILSEYSRVKSDARTLASNAKANALTGDNVTGSIKSETAGSIVAKLMALPKNTYVTDDQRQKMTSLFDCMTRAGVDPNKIVRIAYLFTVAMNKITKVVAKSFVLPKEPAVPDRPDEDDEPQYPDRPNEPGGFFFNKFLTKDEKEAKINEYKAALEEYNAKVTAIKNDPKTISYYAKVKEHEDGVKAHGEWAETCTRIKDESADNAKRLFEDVFKGIEPLFAILRQKAAAPIPEGQDGISPHDVAERNMFADAIIGVMRDTCEGRENTKGLFDKIAGKGLKDLDVRLNACVARENPPVANAQAKPKLSSAKPLSFVKIGLGRVAEMIKKTLSSKIGKDVTIGDLTLTPDEREPKMFTLALKNVDIKKVPGFLRMVFGDSRLISDLNVRIGLDVDQRTGALEMTFGEFASTGDANIAQLLNTSLKMVLANLSERLGPNVFIDDKIAPSVYGLGSISELSVKDAAPVRIGYPADKLHDECFTMKIEPSRFAPLKSLGFDADAKFGGVRFVGNDLVLQAGGTRDEIDSMLVKAQNPGEKDRIDTNKLPGQFCTNIDLGGLGDRVGFIMREKGVAFDSMNVSTNPQDGTVSLEMRNFDIKGAIKGMKGMKGKALRTFGNGSFRLKFKPTVDRATGVVQLKFAEADPLGGPSDWLKKSLVNSYMRSIAESAIPVNPDINIVDSVDSNAPLTLNVDTTAFRDLSKFGMEGNVKVTGFKVTPNGLSLGMDIATEIPRPGRVVESLA